MTRSGRLSAVIDFDGACIGDPSEDLTVAWMVLPAQVRPERRSRDQQGQAGDEIFHFRAAITLISTFAPRSCPLLFPATRSTTPPERTERSDGVSSLSSFLKRRDRINRRSRSAGHCQRRRCK